MNKRSLLLKIVLPVFILTLGFVGMRMLVSQRQTPVKHATPFRGVLVETVGVVQEGQPLQVAATGTVQARQEADIVPQVSGKVVKVADNLVAGRFFLSGELMFALEATDYEIAVEQAEANLSKFELDLETVEARAEIARQEWTELHPDEEPHPLVVYAPQIKNAEAALSSARATLRQAKLELSRTRILAPFNGFVRSESIAIGQYLRAGNPVIRLVGSDQGEILVPISLSDLGWIKVPRKAGESGSKADIRLNIGGREWHWQGWVDRALAEVDQLGRMARIAVVVDDPYGLAEPESERPQLVIGSYVSLSLQGKRPLQAIAVPSRALQEGDVVWVMGPDKRLQIRPVEVVRHEQGRVLVGSGLDGDEQVVITPIPGAANGLQLRTAEP